jgi:hypothetical protein
MAKPLKKSRLVGEVKLEPDAWPRFERFIRDIAKAGPQHRKAKPKAKTARSLKRRGGTKTT